MNSFGDYTTYIIYIYLAILGIMIYDNHPLEESLLTNQDYNML